MSGRTRSTRISETTCSESVPDPIFSTALPAELCQGDVFTEITIHDGVQGVLHPVACHVVVLTNDCDIDKPDTKVLTVVRVRSLSDVNAGLAGNIQRGRVEAAWALPAQERLPLSFVDFRFIERVLREELYDAMRANRRVASMTEEGRAAMIGRLHAFLGRKNPPKAR